MNNFFPALESGQNDQLGNSGLSNEDQFNAQQQLVQGDNPEQVINEVPPEEEEGES